jgi:hypothetical protein
MTATLPRTLPKVGGSVPPPVPSSEVLSEAFPSRDRAPGATLVSAHEKRQRELLERAKTAASEPAPEPLFPRRAPEPEPSFPRRTADDGDARRMPTAPLPAVRGPDPSRPDGPAFAREPWQRSDGPDPLGLSLAVADAAEPGAGRSQREISTDIPPRPHMEGVTLQLPVAIGAAVATLALVVVSFYVGRVSAPAESGVAAVARARTGWVAVGLFARSRASASPPRPCLMLRAPALVAPSAESKIPFEAVAYQDKLAVGYGQSPSEPRGLLFDPATGVAEITHRPALAGDAPELSRVVPIVQGADVNFAETLEQDRGVSGAVFVSTGEPFVVGFTSDKVVKLDKPGADPSDLWDLAAARGRPDALTVTPSPAGYAVSYRYADQIHVGVLKPDRSVAHAAAVVAGSGGIVGKPSVALNGEEVSVVFADKPNAPNAPIELRWARGTLGTPLTVANIVELPAGGPGGDAMAPAIAALAGGRWLLMWTEGQRSGQKTLRAQTYDRKYRPVGDALRVSPATGSFGQGTVGAVTARAVVLFLQATGGGYEMWGTVLQCR